MDKIKLILINNVVITNILNIYFHCLKINKKAFKNYFNFFRAVSSTSRNTAKSLPHTTLYFPHPAIYAVSSVPVNCQKSLI